MDSRLMNRLNFLMIKRALEPRGCVKKALIVYARVCVGRFGGSGVSVVEQQ